MEYGFTTAAYVVAAVLFIQSLGGLSGQESAKRAVWYGIVGMALAVAATLYGPGAGHWLISVVMVAAGGAIGWVVAKRVQMTEMPQLVAAMHSLVGLAAVFLPCAVALGFRNEELVALLIMLGSPTTPSAYVMSRNMGHEGVLTSSCIALTTLLSALTLTGWIFVLRSGGYL